MDRYQQLVSQGITGRVARQVGLPRPATLRRYSPSEPQTPGPVLVIGPSAPPAGADPSGLVVTPVDDSLPDALSLTGLLAAQGLTVHGPSDEPHATGDADRYAAVVVVLSDLAHPRDLAEPVGRLREALRSIAPAGRVVTVSRPSGPDDPPAVAAAREGVEGLIRSVAKELRDGATGNGLLVAPGVPVTAPSVAAGLAFLLSTRSAFVDGQLLRVDSAAGRTPDDPLHPLAGQVAVVTGAARGIGAAIAETLARDGARVVAVDVAAAGEALAATANRVRGTALHLDVTASDAGRQILDLAVSRYGRLDVVVHNAGITRDKLLVNMRPEQWEQVLAVDVESHLRINEALLASDAFTDAPRIVALASTSGIAGNRGQTSYATAKAGVIGWVRSTAPLLAASGGTANAVAPGFIETEMTARIPAATRQVARRLNTLLQGGLPVDVAEAVAFLASPGATGIVGQTLRVCGQNLVGR
jgi:3-oxoacyl-[acyl-carrier protein] reductase